MKRRRGLLVVLSVGSLVLLLYASILTAFSVPVTAQMELANRLPAAGAPMAGSRALVVPASDPNNVPTLAEGEAGWDRRNGSLLVAGVTPSGFPSGTEGPRLARALAYVAPTANGSYAPTTLTLADVPFVENGTVVARNLTLDVAALAQGRAGFLVKGDAEENATFVPREELVGTVARFESPGAVLALFLLGGAGFVAPLVALILTQRRTGRPGVPGGALVCPECGAPHGGDASFCLRCGAWVKP